MKWSIFYPVIQVIAIILSISGCSKCFYCSLYNNIEGYKTNFTLTSPDGIHIDPTGQDINLECLDRMTDILEQCLLKEFGKEGNLSTQVQKDGYCSEISFDPKIKRDCLYIKIPNDWVISNHNPKMQLLKDDAPWEGCEAKGLKPEDGPCKWRAGIQDSNIIVVTPNLFLYGDPLIKLVTSCQSPWFSQPLVKCIMAVIQNDPELNDINESQRRIE